MIHFLKASELIEHSALANGDAASPWQRSRCISTISPKIRKNGCEIGILKDQPIFTRLYGVLETDLVIPLGKRGVWSGHPILANKVGWSNLFC